MLVRWSFFLPSNRLNAVSLFRGSRKASMVRCTNKPTILAVENQPGEDSQIGSMTLCKDCFIRFVQQMPPDYASYREITDEDRR